ncbi:MAG: homocysteine S-methyltransferase family protein [Pseudomonadota bacterium]
MTRYQALLARLNAGEKILIDGGTGTEVERRGVPQLDNAWNGGGALSHPEIVRDIHKDYIRHGAEIVISNTFATTLHALDDAGEAHKFQIYNRRGVEIAVEARDQMQRPDVLVAGGISYWSFTGDHPPLADLRTSVTEQAAIMADAGADLLMLEMMVGIDRMLVTLEAAQSSGLPVWPGLSCMPNEDGVMCLFTGDTLVDALGALTGRGVPLISIMHTDVIHVAACLDIVEQHWDGLVGVYAHSGTMIDQKWTFNETISVDDYADYSQTWLERDVRIIGGCCGIRPDHMAAVSELV